MLLRFIRRCALRRHPLIRTKFQQTMLLASALSWALVTAMPVLNAHSAAQGVWENLCTLNGFKLVKIDDGKAVSAHGKPCPFAHFSSFHHLTLGAVSVIAQRCYLLIEQYHYFAENLRFKQPRTRAPPLSFGLTH